MEFYSIIIDRVGSTNVFNIIQGRLPTRDTHLQTIVDDDLMHEFLSEVERLNHLSNTLSADAVSYSSVDITEELKRIGETFFLQLFPEEIQRRFRDTDRGYLFFHADYRMRNIPWELLHDGQAFIADKFYVGKNISGSWHDVSRPERDRLRVLIIADPTQDLEWARQEGEGLYESLNAEHSADRLDVHFMSGKRITKLNLLNAIKDRDIIHYSGHLHYSPDGRESGWLLYGNKVLRAREIEKAGFAPYLVFSNSCLSSAAGVGVDKSDENSSSGRAGDLAAAFIRANVGNYIGTNWEIKDSGNSYSFAMQFYRAIFEEKTVGEALFEARSYSRRNFHKNDLTWANYVLHGNPMTRIYRSAGKPTFDASRNQLNAKRIMERYPTPIAEGYLSFLSALDQGEQARICLQKLVETFRFTMYTIGSIVFSYCRHMKIPLEERGSDTLSGLVNSINKYVEICRSDPREFAAPGVPECLQLHGESLTKLLNWSQKMADQELTDEAFEAHLVTFQYVFDNLLSDLASLTRIELIYLSEDGEYLVIFQGLASTKAPIIGVEFHDGAIKQELEENRGRICFYNSGAGLIFPLDEYMEYRPETDDIVYPAFP